MIKTSTPKEYCDAPEHENHDENNMDNKEGLKKSVLQNILNYSKSLAVCKTTQLGTQTMTLN